MYMHGRTMRKLAGLASYDDESWGDAGQVPTFDSAPLDIWDIPGVPTYANTTPATDTTRDIWDVPGVPTYTTPGQVAPSTSYTSTLPNAGGTQSTKAGGSWTDLINGALKTWGSYNTNKTQTDINNARIQAQIDAARIAAANGVRYTVGPNGQYIPSTVAAPGTIFGISTPLFLLVAAGAALVLTSK